MSRTYDIVVGRHYYHDGDYDEAVETLSGDEYILAVLANHWPADFASMPPEMKDWLAQALADLQYDLEITEPDGPFPSLPPGAPLDTSDDIPF